VGKRSRWTNRSHQNGGVVARRKKVRSSSSGHQESNLRPGGALLSNGKPGVGSRDSLCRRNVVVDNTTAIQQSILKGGKRGPGRPKKGPSTKGALEGRRPRRIACRDTYILTKRSPRTIKKKCSGEKIGRRIQAPVAGDIWGVRLWASCARRGHWGQEPRGGSCKKKSQKRTKEPGLEGLPQGNGSLRGLTIFCVGVKRQRALMRRCGRGEHLGGSSHPTGRPTQGFKEKSSTWPIKLLRVLRGMGVLRKEFHWRFGETRPLENVVIRSWKVTQLKEIREVNFVLAGTTVGNDGGSKKENGKFEGRGDHKKSGGRVVRVGHLIGGKKQFSNQRRSQGWG